MSDENTNQDLRVCRVCGKQFIPNSKNQKMCSPECAKENMHRISHEYYINTTTAGRAGTTFGALTAIKRLEGNKWLWRCACGKEVERTWHSVSRTDSNASCGHKTDEMIDDFIKNVVEKKAPSTTLIGRIRSITKGRPHKSSKLGLNGIYHYQRRTDLYAARITYMGETITLGVYDNIGDAIAARKYAEQKIFGAALALYDKQEDASVRIGKKFEIDVDRIRTIISRLHAAFIETDNLAYIARETGIPISTISIYFYKSKLPTPEDLRLIADVVGVSPDWLFGESDDPCLDRPIDVKALAAERDRLVDLLSEIQALLKLVK